jgi:hypothetical protein
MGGGAELQLYSFLASAVINITLQPPQDTSFTNGAKVVGVFNINEI